MELTKDQISAEINDPTVKGLIDGLVLPETLKMSEFLAKVLEAGRKAAVANNEGLQPGDENYVASFPLPSVAQIEGGQIFTFGTRVQVPTNLDGAFSPNQ